MEKGQKKLSVDELKKLATEMRAYTLVALYASGSGHPGGSLSAMDIFATLYFNVMKHDPKKPDWDDRDRLILSAGHKAPALYASLAFSGYVKKEDFLKLRKLESGFEGHPNRFGVKGIEISSGSLGQGLSVAIGDAIRAKLDKKDYAVFCLMGDGEQDEGQIWEAAMEAAHFKLDNLIGIVDRNRLQIDGFTKDVMEIASLKDKYLSFGWRAIEIDGHDINKILDAIKEAKKTKGRPTVIIANTIKGKGVSFMENQAGWHGKAPDFEQTKKALNELGFDWDIENMIDVAHKYQEEINKKLAKSLPKFKKDYWWNSQDIMKSEMKATREGFGDFLEKNKDDSRIVCISADLTESVRMNKFCDSPECKKRFFNMGIAEASATNVAAGLAKEGKIAIFSTFGVFASGRNLDQLRTTVCYNNFNVKIAASHSGITVGQDGATHQSLEEFFQMCGLPNMHVVSGSDAKETTRLTEHCSFKVKGPCYIRFGREKTAVVTDDKTPLKLGTANVIRFRQEKENFIDAFDTELGSDYKNEKEDITIIATGIEVAEAMRAAWILKKEFDIETRVINLHTLKPLDKKSIIAAAEDTGRVLTVEEHQKGGLGNLVSAAILGNVKKAIVFDMIGVDDKFGESGSGWELMKYFGLTAEFIAKKAKEMVGKG